MARINDVLSFDIVEKYNTYSDYLSSQLTDTDLEYLEDEEMARQLVELGYRGKGEVIRREEFEERKRAYLERTTKNNSLNNKTLSRTDIDLKDYPVLKAIAEREENIRLGSLTPILFVRDINSKGQEVSAYIDLAQRMKETEFNDFFEDKEDGTKKAKLQPRPSDLSYFNYSTKASGFNHTPQYQVLVDSPSGLMFRSKRDRRIINPQSGTQNHHHDNATRKEITTKEYLQAVIYEHNLRRKQ